MESAFRTTLLEWLRADPVLARALNAISEDGPAAAPAPQLSIVTSAAAEWGGKTERGREVRIALELIDRIDTPGPTQALAEAIERRIATIAPQQDGFRIVVTRFLRSRVERRPRSLRAILLEYSFRLLETAAARPAPLMETPL
ncbi:DUF3168 domain-containing protein [Erythrobacter litoralis]|uniref:DUF3168 domain-containing protein n=1 Tax=Erythrobacter litoralis TaxID=39960 RepID=UPI002435C145|nr:DUF3168 domain-containing protein [Erythrobacter litoralis]MDG6079183.1 DUF3168 domain-containing protein [Erythrobacter litoralis]